MVTVVIRGQPLQSHLTSFYRLLLHHLHQTCFFLLLISPSFPSPVDDPLDLLGLAPSACRPCTSTITQHPKASVHTSQCKLHIDSCSQETGGTSTHKKCGFQTSGVATVAHKGSKWCSICKNYKYGIFYFFILYPWLTVQCRFKQSRSTSH